MSKRRDPDSAPPDPPPEPPSVVEQLAEQAKDVRPTNFVDPDDADEREHDEEEALEAVEALAEAKAEDERCQAWEGIGTARISAYAEAIDKITGLLYPTTPPDSALAVTHDVDGHVQRAMNDALVAMAEDIVRMANGTGPKVGGA